MNVLTWVLLVIAITAGLCLVIVALIVALDGWDARRDAARRNQAHRR